MKIAVTAWGNRVSPVFDSARTLLIAGIENKSVSHTTYVSLHPGDIQGLSVLLKRLGVPILICGAISTSPAEALTENRIKLISFVSGNALEILATFARRNAIDTVHMMPGSPLR